MPNYNDISDELLLKWLNGELSDNEVIETLGEEDLARYRQILSEIDQWQPSTDSKVFDPFIILNRKSNEAKRRFLNVRRIMSIAASLLLIATIGYVYRQQVDVKYSSDFGETREILLPDGISKVILGPNSMLSLKRKHWSKIDRRISLVGKAFFEVNPGSPFSVHTSNGSVEVLGTTFDVNQFDKSIDVKCYEGKVKAVGSNGQSIILKAGQANLYHKENWEEVRPIDATLPSWIQGEAKFKDAPISLVIKELISLYEISVNSSGVNLQRRFTGSFPTNNLNQSLQIVFGTLGINYELDGKKLTLSE